MKKLLFYLFILTSSSSLFAKESKVINGDTVPSCRTVTVPLRCGAEYEDCIVPSWSGYASFFYRVMHYNNYYCGPDVIEPPQ
jgi:hypothetical protein